MAKKKQVKKSVKKVKIDEDLVRKVDSLVDEIERTNNFKKITDDDIEELEATLSVKKMDPIEDKTEELDLVVEEKEEEKKEEEKGKEEIVPESSEENIIEESKDEVEENTEIIDFEVESKKEEKEDTEDKKTVKVEKVSKKKDLNKTNKYEFKFDDERLRELDSLDTSFLEGRINNNSNVKNKKAKKVNDVVAKNVKDTGDNSGKVKIALLVLLLVVISIVLVSCGSIIQVNNMKNEKAKEQEEKNSTKKEPIVDSHYLFVGDSLTMEYDIKESFSGFHLAVSGNEELTSQELLDNLKKYVYQYNPSKVIIQVGINDLLNDKEDNNLEENLREIIKGIKENRPYAKIYIQSLYPINDSDNKKIEYKLVKNLYNNQIEKINSNIKNICKDNSVTYIDVYTALYDKEDNMLNIEYTTNGLSLSEEGYKVVTRKLFEVINKD